MGFVPGFSSTDFSLWLFSRAFGSRPDERNPTGFYETAGAVKYFLWQKDCFSLKNHLRASIRTLMSNQLLGALGCPIRMSGAAI